MRVRKVCAYEMVCSAKKATVSVLLQDIIERYNSGDVGVEIRVVKIDPFINQSPEGRQVLWMEN